ARRHHSQQSQHHCLEALDGPTLASLIPLYQERGAVRKGEKRGDRRTERIGIDKLPISRYAFGDGGKLDFNLTETQCGRKVGQGSPVRLLQGRPLRKPAAAYLHYFLKIQLK